MALRGSWKAALNEAKLVAASLQIDARSFRHRRTTDRKRFHNEHAPDENENEMIEAVESPMEANLYILCSKLDNVIGGPTVRFIAAMQIYDAFCF